DRAASRQRRMRTIGEILGDKTCRLVVHSVTSMPATRRVGRWRRSLYGKRPAVVRVTAFAVGNIGPAGPPAKYRSPGNQLGQIYHGGSAYQIRTNTLSDRTRMAHPRDAPEPAGSVAKSHEFYSASNPSLRGLQLTV